VWSEGTITELLHYRCNRSGGTAMTHHRTQARVYQNIAGAVSALILCCIAVFIAARHFAI
jgi:hypothetical protein